MRAAQVRALLKVEGTTKFDLTFRLPCALLGCNEAGTGWFFVADIDRVDAEHASDLIGLERCLPVRAGDRFVEFSHQTVEHLARQHSNTLQATLACRPRSISGRSIGYNIIEPQANSTRTVKPCSSRNTSTSAQIWLAIHNPRPP